MPDAMTAPKRSSRDPKQLRERITRWLAGRLPEGAAPQVSEVRSPSGSGMSSETLLFDARWREAGEPRGGAFVARVAPDPADAPVFPRYDLEQQYRVMKLVGEKSDVPVPRVRWLESDPAHLGGAFFVMDRVEGRVPSDIPPYALAGWLREASPEQRRLLQDESVGILAKLHAIDVRNEDVSFLEPPVPARPDDTPLRRHFADLHAYYEWARGERRFPVLERAFEWLEAHWPGDEGDTVISWGDARIGNVMYRGFEPCAVLDWEMASLGPRGLDVGWMIYLHSFFEFVLRDQGTATLPDMLRREDVARTYEERSGHAPGDLDFFEVYAALRHGIVMTRVFARMQRFGEAQWPDDPDAVIPHAAQLAAMIGERR